MPERNIGKEILEGIQEIKRFKKGKGSLRTRTLRDPSSPKQIREQLSIQMALRIFWATEICFFYLQALPDCSESTGRIYQKRNLKRSQNF